MQNSLDDLTYLREEINKIDEEMTTLFLKRMEVVSKVAEYKKKNAMEVLDKTREAQMIDKYLSGVSSESQKAQLKAFLESVIEISRSLQSELLGISKDQNTHSSDDFGLKIGYQGAPGSFSHQAAIDYFGEAAETACFLSFKDVFEAIQKNEIKYGVLPIENSSTGGISEVNDLLGSYNFYIVGEKCTKVEHRLLGIAGAELEDIEEVYSHAQGFLQCSRFFEAYPDWRLIPYFNTAKSAAYISREGLKSKACVASSKAGAVYGLNILKADINNRNENYTRFIIIAKDMMLNVQNDKISVALTLPHKAGSLYHILKLFAENNANMTKIESRPIADKSWEYCFYIDFNGNLLDENTKKMLNTIELESTSLKVLGNYKSEVVGR